MKILIMRKGKLFLPLIALSLTFGLVACGANNDQPSDGSKSGSKQPTTQQTSSTPKKETIKVTAADNKVSLEPQETVQLTAKVGDTVITDATWETTDATIASVNAGLVTGLKKGEVTITAKKDGYNAGTLAITVTNGGVIVQVESGTSENNAITFKDSHNVETDMVDAWPQNAVLTLEFNAKKAGAYELHVFCRAHGGYQSTNTDVFADIMEVKINDAAVTLSGQAEGGTFTDYKMADVNLVAGKNTMTIRNLAADADDGSTCISTIDLFEFVPKA